MAPYPIEAHPLEAAFATAIAALRVSGVVGADLGDAAARRLRRPRERRDALDAHDPEFIRDTLPALRLVSQLYFRGEVRGMAHVPHDVPVLLVGNHSGGMLIVDTFVFAHAFYDHFGPERRFHQLAHSVVFRMPATRAVLSRYGTIPASPENLERALESGAPVLVYPGGERESYRPSWETARVDFAGRTGFVRSALALRVPIVPVVAIGGQETALFLGQGRRLAERLRLDRLLGLKVLPAQLAPPLGLTILDLPSRIPLPAKITIRVLPMIDLHDRLGRDPDVDEAYRLVTSTMQSALTELAAERTFPVVG
jgi:1-acyl-sn-glycerol-3-phosphate acyltransferase